MKVENLILAADFIVLDREEDKEAHIIFRRSFLATGRALINVAKGNSSMRVHDKEVSLTLLKLLNILLTLIICLELMLCNKVLEKFFSNHS